MSNVHCAITTCKMTMYNKPPGVTFYSCPTSHETRNRWLMVLKNKCSMLDWAKSKICSKHFENKYIDSNRRLKDHAIPTLFPSVQKAVKASEYASKTRIDRLLNKQSQTDLMVDIKSTMNRLREPQNIDNYITDDLKCKSDTPEEIQLLLLAKKQNHLITRLMEQVSQQKKHVAVLKKNMEEYKSSKKDNDQSVESMKYIVKCLQEKHATLEEQIEILTAVESR